jgi:hypothetical protein
LYISEHGANNTTNLFAVSLLGFTTAQAFANFADPATVDVTATSDNATGFFLDDKGAYSLPTSDASTAVQLSAVTTGLHMLLTLDQQRVFVSSVGTTTAAPVIQGTSVATPYGNGYLAQDSNAVYFASPTSLVFVPPTFTGGTPTVIYSNANLDVGGIFVDGASIYFVDEGNTTVGRAGSILACSKLNIATTPCVNPTVVATGLTHPTTLIGDSNALYFLTDDGTQFTLNAVAKPSL